MAATWAKIDGWPYRVSTAGEVANAVTGKILLAEPHWRGYLRVTLYRKPAGGKPRRRHFRIHRLVLEAHAGPSPAPGMVAHHKNDKRDDNRLKNLEWLSGGDNSRAGGLSGLDHDPRDWEF